MRGCFFTLFIALLLFTSSCRRGTELWLNDYEHVAAQTPQAQTVTTARAHSGRHAVKVDADHEFGLGYQQPLSTLAPRPRTVRLEAWAYLPSNRATARLVLQAVDPATGREVYASGVDLLDQAITFHRWAHVRQDIELPASLRPQHELRAYLWRSTATDTAYVDDLRLLRLN